MKNKAIKTVVFCFILLSSLNGIAQPATTSDDVISTLEGTETDAAAGPINDYIVPMLLIGAVLGFSLLKRNTNVAS